MRSEESQAKLIFLDAVEIAVPAERQAYVAAQCGSDLALRRDVEGLLVHYEAQCRFLEDGARAASSEPPVMERPSTVIGPYKLLQQIGEGGMGAVFMAEQTQPVRRRVALKVIKAGMDSRQVVARFEAERQALAMMDHQNIARVLDVGTTEEGRPFFVMELVHGIPITKYCDDNHLTPRERLELFVPVCQAIQHAHQKGVIHRDVKPTNVMVTLYDGKPVPKVIDFGVAKATEQSLTERTMFTPFGQMVGTLEYMSPEQAEMSDLGADTRSDIYSLGVLLYELLTGTTPLCHKRLKEAAFGEMLRMIKEEEPPKPSTRLSTTEEIVAIATNRGLEPAKLRGLVRGELDWIVMKALEKDRNRRYETASAFAADVQRYLDDEPVHACPLSATYRLRKFVRRYRTVLSLAGLFVGLVALGGAVSAWQAIRATLAERQALADRDRAQQERDRAETSYRLARVALDEVVKLQVDPRFQQGSLEDVRRTLLQAEAAFYQQFVQQKGEDSQFQSERVSAFLRLADVTSRLASKEEAIQHAQQALAIAQALASAHPESPGYHADLARTHDTLGLLYQETGRYKEAETNERQAIAISERLAHAHPTIAQYQSQLALQHYHHCRLYQATGQAEEAEASSRNAISVSAQLVGSYPTVAQYQADLARSYLALNVSLRYAGRNTEAEAALKHAIALLERLTHEHPEVREYQLDLARSQQDLGVVYMDMRRYELAEDLYRKSLGILERLVSDHPTVTLFQIHLATIYSNLGIACMDTGHYNEANAWFQKAITLRERLTREHPTVPEYHADLANSHIILVASYARSNRPDKADAVLKGIATDSLDEMGLYNLACAYALLAQALRKHPEEHARGPERQRRADDYAARAVNVLHLAVARGIRNVSLMQTDHDLDVLRSRNDFKTLLAELEQKAKK